MYSKSLFLSKTFWFNFLTFAVTIASAYGYVPNQEVAVQASSVLLVITPLVNIALRYLTKKAVYLVP